MKKALHTFVSAIIDKNYKQANANLKAVVDEKIKQRIINNNVKIF